MSTKSTELTLVLDVDMKTPDVSCYFVAYPFMNYMTGYAISLCSNLTHCGLVTPYGDMDLVQHRLVLSGNKPVEYLNQWWLSTVRAFGIYLRADSHEVLKMSIH